MTKDNKNCPVCFGKGKVKTVKTLAHIGNYYLGKEEYIEPCYYCDLQEFAKDDYGESTKTLH